MSECAKGLFTFQSQRLVKLGNILNENDFLVQPLSGLSATKSLDYESAFERVLCSGNTSFTSIRDDGEANVVMINPCIASKFGSMSYTSSYQIDNKKS